MSLHKKDLALFMQIVSSLGVGRIWKQGVDSIQFRVQSLKDLKVIIASARNIFALAKLMASPRFAQFF